jgi:hypothetical protein
MGWNCEEKKDSLVIGSKQVLQYMGMASEVTATHVKT